MDRDVIARRFPLISRARPPGLPLEVRVRELGQLARDRGEHDEHGHMIRAGEVCNKAALIASDCAMPHLARELCWRQHDIFDQARPLPAPAAKLALQPVLNIPRQLIREGDGDGAYQILDQLYRAARARTEIEVAGRRVTLRDVTCAPDDHKTVTTLLWAALLADGTRALAQAGRWQEAADHATRHRGVGDRLLDGRQVTILALVDRDDLDRAAEMVDDSVTEQPWEDAVASALRVYCQHVAGTTIARDVETMLDRALGLLKDNDPSTVVFRTRLAMTALDLAEGFDMAHIPALRNSIMRTAAADAYAARDVLAHPDLCSAMTTDQQRSLNALVRSSGLGRATMPPELLTDLLASVRVAEDRLRGLLHYPENRDNPAVAT